MHSRWASPAPARQCRSPGKEIAFLTALTGSDSESGPDSDVKGGKRVNQFTAVEMIGDDMTRDPVLEGVTRISSMSGSRLHQSPSPQGSLEHPTLGRLVGRLTMTALRY